MDLKKLVICTLISFAATGVYAGQEGKKMGGGPGGPGGGPGPAAGAGPGPGAGQGSQARMQIRQMDQLQLRNIDINGDGIISRDEVQTHERLTNRMQQNWAEADQNNDGSVDVSEFAAFREQTKEQLQQQQQTSSPEEESQ